MADTFAQQRFNLFLMVLFEFLFGTMLQGKHS